MNEYNCHNGDFLKIGQCLSDADLHIKRHNTNKSFKLEDIEGSARRRVLKPGDQEFESRLWIPPRRIIFHVFFLAAICTVHMKRPK